MVFVVFVVFVVVAPGTTTTTSLVPPTTSHNGGGDVGRGMLVVDATRLGVAFPSAGDGNSVRLLSCTRVGEGAGGGAGGGGGGGGGGGAGGGGGRDGCGGCGLEGRLQGEWGSICGLLHGLLV